MTWCPPLSPPFPIVLSWVNDWPGQGIIKAQGKFCIWILHLIYFSTSIIIKQTKPHYLWLSPKQQSHKVHSRPESEVPDRIPLFPHLWARGRGADCWPHQGTGDNVALALCHLSQWYPSPYLKLSHCLRKEAGSKGHEAAGSQPIVQSAEPQPGLAPLRYHPAAAAFCLLCVCRPQNTCFLLVHLLGGWKCTLVFWP